MCPPHAAVPAAAEPSADLQSWEGVRALVHPAVLESFWVGVAVLLVALALDGASRAVAKRALREQARERGVTVRTLLRESPDPTVTTVLSTSQA